MKEKRLSPITALLESSTIRRVRSEQDWYYAAADVIATLCDSADPVALWEQVKQSDPQVAQIARPLEMPADERPAALLDALSLRGVLRLVQSLHSPAAERIKRWLAQTAEQRLEELENPELAILRTARLYQQRGRSRTWIDKRLRGISARHEITAEWRRRGVSQSDQYRALTNDLMHAAFGMDVNAYRRFKGLTRPNENLRDHMTDLELTLTTLAETVAGELHRARRSEGFEQVNVDARDAGAIVADARRQIEQAAGVDVVRPGRHGAPPAAADRLPGEDAPEAPRSPERPGTHQPARPVER